MKTIYKSMFMIFSMQSGYVFDQNLGMFWWAHLDAYILTKNGYHNVMNIMCFLTTHIYVNFNMHNEDLINKHSKLSGKKL